MSSTVDTNNSSLNESTRRCLNMLKESPVVFNAMDLTPSECVYYVPLDKMEGYILRTAESFLGKGEVKYASLEYDRPSQAPYAYIWLSAHSRHLEDHSSKLNDSNMVFTPQVKAYSEELKKFADLFAPTKDDNGMPIKRKNMIQRGTDRMGNTSLTAIRVDLNRMLMRLFDVDNRAFIDTFGPSTSNRRCTINCSIKYARKDGPDGERRMTAIKVVKSLEGVNANGPYRPVVGYRNRRSDYRRNDD